MSKYQRIIPEELHVGLFNTPNSVKRAVEYAVNVLERMQSNERIMARTAYQCLINAIIAEETRRIEAEES